MKFNQRNNATIELLRMFLLSFLISFHWTHFAWDSEKFLDTMIVKYISKISVPSFAAITGFFVFTNRNLFWRNLSRIFFIIIFSFILSFITALITSNEEFSFANKMDVIMYGGRDSWYLYAILFVYLLAPLIYKKLDLKKAIVVTIFLLIAYFWFFHNGFVRVFGFALLGFCIKKISEIIPYRKQMLWSNITFFLIIGLILLVYGLLLYAKVNLLFFSEMLISFVGVYFCWMALINPIKNKKLSKFIGYLAINSYFIYEYHWLLQHVWNHFASDFINNYKHLQLYVNWIVITIIGFFISWPLTIIYKHFWYPNVTKPLEKLFFTYKY